jgi:hypothetical protein
MPASLHDIPERDGLENAILTLHVQAYGRWGGESVPVEEYDAVVRESEGCDPARYHCVPGTVGEAGH